MILKRISEQIVSQNWFAVIVEFAIVVLGVFMGLQVQDWNDERKERIEEKDLLIRLYQETQELSANQRLDLEDRRQRAILLAGVTPVLYSIEPARSFSGIECREVLGSHVNRRPPDELPVLDEMIATGEFGILRDSAIKELLRQYILTRERTRAHYVEITNELFRLHSRYPDFIELEVVPVDSGLTYRSDVFTGDELGWTAVCHVDKMRANVALLNDFADNLARMRSVTAFMEQRQEILQELEASLSKKFDGAMVDGPIE